MQSLLFTADRAHAPSQNHNVPPMGCTRDPSELAIRTLKRVPPAFGSLLMQIRKFHHLCAILAKSSRGGGHQVASTPTYAADSGTCATSSRAVVHAHATLGERHLAAKAFRAASAV